MRTKANQLIGKFNQLKDRRKHLEAEVLSASNKMVQIKKEQDLIERSTVVLQQVKPLLSASSIKQCETLANSAIQSIFGFPYTVEFNAETQRFILNKGDYITDLADSEGGGILTVISAVFELFLLVKLGKRRFMAYDESWYAVSDDYYDAFIAFMRQACKDLGVDLMVISHDVRLTTDMVDIAYKIADGKSIRVK